MVITDSGSFPQGFETVVVLLCLACCRCLCSSECVFVCGADETTGATAEQ